MEGMVVVMVVVVMVLVVVEDVAVVEGVEVAEGVGVEAGDVEEVVVVDAEVKNRDQENLRGKGGIHK